MTECHLFVPGASEGGGKTSWGVGVKRTENEEQQGNEKSKNKRQKEKKGKTAKRM